MPTPRKKIAAPRSPRPAPKPKAGSALRPTRSQRALHALGNTLSAARLRLDILTRDPTCMWAQKENLEALTQILNDAIAETNRLERLI